LLLEKIHEVGLGCFEAQQLTGEVQAQTEEGPSDPGPCDFGSAKGLDQGSRSVLDAGAGSHQVSRPDLPIRILFSVMTLFPDMFLFPGLFPLPFQPKFRQ
jgi:hypothetical protein